MGSLTGCIKKAGKALDASDREAILERSAVLHEGGMDAHAAAVQAVDERLEHVRTSIAKFKAGPSAEPAKQQVEPAAEAVDKSEAAPTVETPPAGAQPTAGEPAAKSKPGKIEDFGEKLEGARKDYADVYRDRIAEAEGANIATEPLSKSWPEPDYHKLLDGGASSEAVALARATRDVVPTKPQSAWKVKAWAEMVGALRDMTWKVLSGEMPLEKARSLMHQPEHRRVADEIRGLADLYAAVGHDTSLKGLRVSVGQYSMYEGKRLDPAKTIWTVERTSRGRSWPERIVDGTTRDEVIAKFKEKGVSEESAPSEPKHQFVIYKKRGQQSVFIGKRIGREHVDLKIVTDVAEARRYIAEHLDELEAALERYKSAPFERKTENAPRIGEDHRDGAPVTPEVFASTFGFRGVQFGNYVEGDRRQSDLNQSFDALMDLAAVLDVPPRALSLNGRLGLAFGARGHGGKNAAAAHYESGRTVINLTKGAGPGSLAHEWWHAADNYFAKNGGDAGYMTGAAKGDKLRPQVQGAFMTIRRIVRSSPMFKRAEELDKRRAKPYWATPHEMSARVFESYVIAKLQDQSAANDYLANVVSKEAWDRMESSSGRSDGTYPYPTAAEMDAIRGAYDDFFNVVETRADDAGNVAMLSRAVDGDEANALRALSENDDLFALPKSERKSVSAIAFDIDPTIKVQRVASEPGRSQSYKITMPDDKVAWLYVRKPLLNLPTVYGFDLNEGEMSNVYEGRPGTNPEAVPEDKEDVYIDVSKLAPGSGGSKVYAIAGAFAHNTDRMFIGDPSGFTDEAMRRRLEAMLSLALRYGTTDFLAPHPRQEAGAPSIGVPALKWTYGDDLGNIRRLVDANVKALENAGLDDAAISFDPANGTFNDSGGSPVSRSDMDELAKTTDLGRAALAGGRTIARGAVLRALLREEGRSGEADGRRDGLLASIARLGSDSPQAVNGLFSRGAGGGVDIASARAMAAKLEAQGVVRMNVVQSVSDIPPPQRKAVLDRAPDGRARGAYMRQGDSIWLIADNIRGANEFVDVALHEAFHRGLARTIPAAAPLLRQMDRTNRSLRQAATAQMKAYGIERDEAIEEALAVMAQAGTLRDLKGWPKLLELIRGFLTKVVKSVGIDMKWTDDMVADFVAGMTREGLQRGAHVDTGEAAAMSQLAKLGEQSASGSPDAGPRLSRVGDAVADAASAVQRIVSAEAPVVGATKRVYSEAQTKAMKNVGFHVEPPSAGDRLKSLWKDAGKKLARGLVDQFAPIKDIDKTAYGLLRLSKGAAGAFETLLNGGKLKLNDGVYDFDQEQRGGVLERLLMPLQGEHHDFLRWVAANRAERLAGLGKENLFKPSDIEAIKSLADGVAPYEYTIQHGANKGTVTRDRTLIYADALRTFNEFHANVLDMAEQSELIDPEARKLWENEFYVPFYRVEDDGSVAGADIKNGAVRQEAFRSLTGRTNKLNADLLENTLMNWSHLIDAAAKNRAAKASIEAAERMGAAVPIDGHEGKGSVWFREGGEKRWSMVTDPYVLSAVTALQFNGMRGPVIDAMGAFKRALTIGVTASPFFKVRNLIRDSVQAIGTTNIGFNPVQNVAQGWKLTDPKSDAYFRLMASGGTIHFGSMMEGSEAKRVQSLVEAGVDKASILDSDQKVRAFYRRFIGPAVNAYNELGDRGEAINRASLYEQLVRQGVSHADAALQARDLMDFSMQGSFATIRFLTQVVPFFNARLQGMYKLGHSGVVPAIKTMAGTATDEERAQAARFGAVIGAAALLSIALMAGHADDDDWKKREDWDRNNYWWFKFGGIAFRIPKPFEVGAVATLAERTAEAVFDKEMTGARYRAQVLSLLSDNLSMNPIPQMFKPAIEVYANKDSFTGRPIESAGMDKLRPEYRFNAKTSMIARGLSTASNAVTGLAGIDSLSPVQIDHLIQGYLSGLGALIVSASDVVVRPLTGQPERPAPDFMKAATGGMASRLDDAPSRYVTQLYNRAKSLEEAYGTWRELMKEGKVQEASEFRADHAEDIKQYRYVERVKSGEARINARIRFIEQSSMDAGAKREQIRQLQTQKDRLARQVAVTS